MKQSQDPKLRNVGMQIWTKNEYPKSGQSHPKKSITQVMVTRIMTRFYCDGVWNALTLITFFVNGITI